MGIAGIFAVIFGLIVASFFLGGWIVPLVIGLKARSQNNPGYKAWLVFASVWGVFVLAATVGYYVLYLFLVSSRFSMSGVGKVSDFSAASYKGETGKIKVAFVGDSHLIAECGKLGQKNFSSSNGIFTVPAGKLTIRNFETVAQDKSNRKWIAKGNYHGVGDPVGTVDVTSGNLHELKIGPPLKASIKVTFSALSDSISMNPVYVDGNGGEYMVCSDDRKGTAPQFQLVDGENKVVMSGKFVFG
ncbi:MAG: hypothetical protein PHR77_22145 [Kiritimatiellae bacterium]|nr:hypothetical protein [Kiritimatiellia bacterium]MDD5520443.1 hypothetical protein [Kiritimatiellia bacterium]